MCQKFRATDFSLGMLRGRPCSAVVVGGGRLAWLLPLRHPSNHAKTSLLLPGGGHPTFCGHEAPLGLHPPSGTGSSAVFPGPEAQSSAFCVHSFRLVSGRLRVLVFQCGHTPEHIHVNMRTHVHLFLTFLLSSLGSTVYAHHSGHFLLCSIHSQQATGVSGVYTGLQNRSRRNQQVFVCG